MTNGRQTDCDLRHRCETFTKALVNDRPVNINYNEIINIHSIQSSDCERAVNTLYCCTALFSMKRALCLKSSALKFACFHYRNENQKNVTMNEVHIITKFLNTLI